MPRFWRACPLAAALLAAACGAAVPEYFRPTEKVAAVSNAGNPVAVYDVTLTRGHAGEIKVWSTGAFAGTVDGADRTMVQIAMEVENSGDAPLAVETQEGRLEEIVVGRLLVRGAAPVAVTPAAEASVPPGEVRRFDFYFALPVGVDPQDVDAFRLRWSVTAGGERYVQFTPFVEHEPRRYYPTYAGYEPYLGLPAYAYYPTLHPYYYPFDRVVVVRTLPPRPVVIRRHRTVR